MRARAGLDVGRRLLVVVAAAALLVLIASPVGDARAASISFQDTPTGCLAGCNKRLIYTGDTVANSLTVTGSNSASQYTITESNASAPNITVTGCSGCSGSGTKAVTLPFSAVTHISSSINDPALVFNLGDGNDVYSNSPTESLNYGRVRAINGQGGNEVFLDKDEGTGFTLNTSGLENFSGGAGNDIADYSDRTASFGVTIRLGGTSGSSAGSSDEDDWISDDVEDARGGTGDDRIHGSGIANRLYGGPSTGVLSGHDEINGRGGSDQEFGYDGNDVLGDSFGYVDGEADILDGGAGIDTATYAYHTAGVAATIDDVANDGNSADASADNIKSSVENIDGSPYDDMLVGDVASPVSNDIDGLNGDDLIVDGPVSNGPDSFHGGAGTDTISYAQRTQPVVIRLDGLRSSNQSGELGENDSIDSDIENAIGGHAADVIVGSGTDFSSVAGNNRLDGRSGADRVFGLGGQDELIGTDDGNAPDELDCGEGLDTAEVDFVDRPTPSCEEILGETPPTPTITDGPGIGPGATVAEPAAKFEFTGAAPGGSFQCRLDAGEYENCVSPKLYAVADGPHSFSVRQVNRTSPSADATYAWTVDTAAPAAPQITAQPSDPTNATSASFSFTGESGASFECRLDAGAFANCNSPKTYGVLAEGPHTFQVRQRDAAGNQSVPASHTWRIDTTPPQNPVITSKPQDPSGSSVASFEFTGEPGGSFQCKLDTGSFVPCTSPKSYTALAQGPHTFSVRQIDSAGTAGPAESYTWIVDTAGPAPPTITSKPADPSNLRAASFGFTGAESGGSFECKLDAAAYEACLAPRAYAGLADGAHTFSVRQIDGAGNAGTAGSYTWTVDATAPAPPAITSAPDRLSSSDEATFEFSGEAGASMECRLDTEGFSPCASPKTYTGLAAGPHDFQVRQTDAAGNASAPATHAWAYAAANGSPSQDCTSPTATVADGFAGPTYVMLRIQQANPSETWICFRAQDGSSSYLGGKATVDSGSTSVGQPTQDESFDTCQNQAGNQVPGNHPALSGEIGDPDDPPHVPYLVDTFADANEAWLCLRIADFEKRVLVPIPGAQAPEVTFAPDAVPVPAPDPPKPPAGYPSRTCQDGVGGEHDEAVNAELAGGTHLWLESWRPAQSQAHLCVRLEGPIGIGGALSLDATGSPGVTPVLTPGSDMTPCPINVVSNDQAGVQIKRSPAGTNPAAICVRRGSTEDSLVVGTTGSPSPPAVLWSPDPGTPGAP